MPRGVRKLTERVCPNFECGKCISKKAVWKMQKSYDVHVAKCELANSRKPSLENQGAVMAAILDRISLLENAMARVQAENKQLREQVDSMRAKRTPYVLRKNTVGTPELGWGQFTCEAFMSGLVRARKWYHDQPFTGELHSLGVKSTIIPAAWYFANNAKILSFDVNDPKNREGYPFYINVNRRSCQRRIELDQCVRGIFKVHWLPSIVMLEGALGSEVNSDSRDSYTWLQNRLRHQPSTSNRDYDSYKARVDLLMYIGAYSPPNPPVQKTKEQKESDMRSAKEQWFDDEVQQSGRFWTYCTMTELVETYELSYGDVPSYQQLVHEYLNFEHCSGKKEEYLKLGGLFA